MQTNQAILIEVTGPHCMIIKIWVSNKKKRIFFLLLCYSVSKVPIATKFLHSTRKIDVKKKILQDMSEIREPCLNYVAKTLIIQLSIFRFCTDLFARDQF